MANYFDALLNDGVVKAHILSWLQEDCPSLDYGGFVVGSQLETAIVLAKSDGILAGCPFFEAIFKQLNCQVNWCENIHDGVQVGPTSSRQTLAQVSGRACDLLRGERVALNCMARASGIATISHRAKKLAKECGWQGKIAGTRKTTPGFRLVEKYALIVGGVDTHRNDLSSMVMLKDNHIWTVGDVSQAVKKCRSVSGFSLKIEVECRNLTEAREAAKAGCDVVMLDNFTPEALKCASEKLKSEFPHVIIEASGGITLETLIQYCTSNVDVVSLGLLTQGYSTVNLSLKILRDGKDPWNKPVIKNDI